jgi:type IV pilus assembly PilX-like protein
MKRITDAGSALIVTMFVVIGLSIVGASLTVLALSETYGSMNYRLMSQARYGAESGVHAAANFILNNYVPPGTPADPLAAYNTNVVPVTAAGTAVVLSNLYGTYPNYPVGGVNTAFANATTGSLTSGNENVQYTASAKLMAMRQINVYGSVTPLVVQTWELTGRGITTGARNANVDVTATLERQLIPTFSFAVFATAPTCGALKFGGGAAVDSYDAGNIVMQNGAPATQQYGGNIGSNGNLNENGNTTTIYGTMSTPKTGVGSCSANGVDAWTDNGGATVTGGLVHLPQVLTYPPPDWPNPMPPTNNTGIDKNSTCASLGIAGCAAGNPSGVVLPPGSYGNLNLTAQGVVHLTTGVYQVNSLSLSGNSQLVIDSGPVVFNLGGQGVQYPLDLTGGTLSTLNLDPRLFQIEYAGTSGLKMEGGSASSGLIYAPNAAVSFAGGSNWYGGVVAATVDDTGGTKIHNDRRTDATFFTAGNYMLSAFSWKKY